GIRDIDFDLDRNLVFARRRLRFGDLNSPGDPSGVHFFCLDLQPHIRFHHFTSTQTKLISFTLPEARSFALRPAAMHASSERKPGMFVSALLFPLPSTPMWAKRIRT